MSAFPFALMLMLFSINVYSLSWNYNDYNEGNMVYIDNPHHYVDKINLTFSANQCETPFIEVHLKESFYKHEKQILGSSDDEKIMNSFIMGVNGSDFFKVGKYNLLTVKYNNVLKMTHPEFISFILENEVDVFTFKLYSSLTHSVIKKSIEFDLTGKGLSDLISSSIVNCNFRI